MSVTKVATRLRRLARHLDAPVIAISSVSRAYTGKNRKALQAPGAEENPLDWLNAAKDSGDVEISSAVFVYLDTDEDVDQLGESAARLIVAKSRRGRRGFVGLRFHGPSGRFVEAPGSVEAMKPQTTAGRDEAKVLAFAKRLDYQPLAKRDLREKVKGVRATAVDRAIERLIEAGELEEREEEFTTSNGRKRKRRVIVAVQSEVVNADE